MSGVVPSIADLPSWPAQGQVCRKRDVTLFFSLLFFVYLKTVPVT